MKAVVTVGTSLFENENVNILDIEGQSFEEWQKNEEVIEEIEDEIEIDDLDENCCAEITSLMKIKDSLEKVYLICSDTIESALAGKIIKQALEQKGFSVEFELEYGKGVVKDLRVDSIEKFQKGVDNLIEHILTITEKKFKDVIFNISGGYKAVIPYLTIIGQITNSKIVYIFENSNELIELPKLPVGFDEKIAELYLPYLSNYILNNISQISQSEVVQKLIELRLVSKKDGKYEVTPLGNFFKSQMNHKPSAFGDLIELLLFAKLSKEVENKNVKQGVDYNFECNGQQVKGDIDIVLENENEIEVWEVKSLAQIEKFLNEQLEKYICYLQKVDKNSKKIVLFVYLVDGRLLDFFEEKFQKIALPQDIDFEVKYIELPPKDLQNKIRSFKEIEIKSKRINDV